MKENLYKRQISYVLYKIKQENDLPYFSLSYCVLSTHGESLKIYLAFFQKELQKLDKERYLELMNKKYSFLIKKELVKKKVFRRIPSLRFFIDKEYEMISKLQKTNYS
ncbi:ribosome-binding factor A [endosymbiont GvMRE of Glomus versiforme]|uniref:ribosome-binding factor A n=1 Tax=endosymbiont GvMRE of Glomus versiforme TaxID=2039283 RepID=UPI0011C37263|nr:ribosome-binding factor A [endosymbiont GvMRE of Glomus versiforme]